HEERLGETRNALEEPMPAREETEEHLLHHALLPDDLDRDLSTEVANGILEGLDGRGCGRLGHERGVLRGVTRPSASTVRRSARCSGDPRRARRSRGGTGK